MLNNKKLQLFPVIKKRRGVRVTQGEPIQVYCSCRMPDVGEMIECSGCGEWYHMPSCATADQDALNDTNIHWYCHCCNKKLKSPKTWIQNNLYMLSAWLSDDIIEAAQALIRDSNPLMGGLQLPYLGQTC